MPTLKEVTAPSPESTSKPEEHRSSDPSVPNPPKNADDELPSLSESRRDRISAAIQTFMDNSQRVATETSSWASSATGTSYRAIERLKKQNADLETELAKSRDNLTVCRKEYQSIVSRRLQTQREVNTLLARKDGWTPQDLERFTSLYRDDHTLDASVNAASQALATAERETEQLRERLITGILGRYHEEQIWSDRIRRLSTWGTWGLMGVNVLLFFVFQFGAEPWRRRRLVHGFEEKVAEGVKKVLDEERERARAAGAAKTIPIAADVLVVDEKEGQAEAAAAEAVEEKDAVTEAPGVQVEDETATTPPTFPAPTATSLPEDTEPETWTQAWNRRKSFLLAPDRWKPALLDLASDRVVWLHMRDVSILVVEGIAAGAVMAGTLMIWVVGTGVARK
ncbi:hypothetical protein MKZ38_009342 [Zalerion maritima]|uniref:Sensitive to high expression protein 9, mitochondrial n=1 Tax=Zalerion maritima TaxID=339359 RepID=A0AAD5RUV6_9PEZI|nr:hypothetical protein MKZ38_009342 [Zalerion maritima]